MMRIRGRGWETGHSAALGRRQFLRDAGLTVAVGGWLLLKPSSSGAGPVTIDRYGDSVQTVGRGDLPEFVRGSPEIASVYRFATDQAGDLEYIPCFCGCKNIGHRSNRDCYIKSFNGDGTVTYTSHGAT
ncbi:MAG: hypothetical protein HY724_05850 [Candidatus Rokubacteria bacterium]|nr:hypothetical protein [Candidatus Rokubacteria bacterium]